MYAQEELSVRSATYPHADIVFSHAGPAPSGYNNIAHQGFRAITDYIYKNHIPYCIHGHYHDPQERTLSNGCKDICVYQCQLIEFNI